MSIRTMLLMVELLVILTPIGLLDNVFDEISAYTLRLWKHPETEELILQVLTRVVQSAFGVRIATARKRRKVKPVASDMTIV